MTTRWKWIGVAVLVIAVVIVADVVLGMMLPQVVAPSHGVPS